MRWCAYMCVLISVEFRGQFWASFLGYHLSCFLGQYHSLSSKPHLSPLPQCWDYQCVPHPTFIRDGTQVFLLVLVWQAFHCLSYLLSSKPIKELIDFVRALMIIVS